MKRFVLVVMFLLLLFLFPSGAEAQIVLVSSSEGLGTGIVLDGRNVLTCNHCVHGSMYVTFPSGMRPAIVSATDPRNDLALLAVETEGPPIRVAPRFARPKWDRRVKCLALDGLRECEIESESVTEFVTTYQTVPGKSGSALLNRDGELIGVLARRQVDSGKAICIHSDLVHDFLTAHWVGYQTIAKPKPDTPGIGFFIVWLLVGCILLHFFLKKGR